MKLFRAAIFLLAAAPLRAGERALPVVRLPNVTLGAAQAAGANLSIVPELPKQFTVANPLASLVLRPSPQLLTAQAAALHKGASASAEEPTAFGGLKLIEAASNDDPGKKGAEASLSIGKRFDGAGRAVSGGVFMAGGEHAPFKAALSQGVLTVTGADSPAVDAKEELALALQTFGKGVSAITGGHEVRTLAADAGFTTALVGEDGALSLFVRPEDVVLDRSGKPWRRSARKREKTAVWERLTDGQSSVWVLRRSDHGELLVAEYPGEGMPVPGTPARALAVFSPGGGSYVDAAKAVMLNAEAERAAYNSNK